MQIGLWLFFAGPVSAAPAGFPKSPLRNDGSELLRREHSRLEQDSVGEEQQRAKATASYSLTEYSLTDEQRASAHELGQAIARQPKHERERMMNVLQAIIDHAEERIKEHHKLYPDHKGPVSLVQEDVAADNAGLDDDGLDAVPQHKIEPISFPTPESLAQESGWMPPSDGKQEGVPYGFAQVEHQTEQHPLEAHHSVGLSEYWKRAALAAQKHTSRVLPSYFTEKNPELPPDLSAFEKDNYEGASELSEYFGPFRLDYGKHVIDVDGWNFVVSSPEGKPGVGNLMIGKENFVNDATNSFVIGIHNTARGKYAAVVGGRDNEADGTGDTVVGGEENVAEGQYNTVAGGYRNEAIGFYATASGGAMNAATGNFAVAAGGQNNFADRKSVV